MGRIQGCGSWICILRIGQIRSRIRKKESVFPDSTENRF